MELKNIHRGSDAYMVLSLTNDGVRMDFSTMEDIVVATYADSQKAFAGKCEILSIEGTAMRVKSPAKAQRFVGAQRLVLTCTYDGRTASYDAPAFNVVATSAEVDSQGMTAEQENADIGIDLKVEDVTSSLVQEIVSAAVKATDEAHSASLEAIAQAERAGVSADEADKSSALAQQKAVLAATKASDAEAAATRANEAVATINGKFAEQDKFISDTINEQNEQIQTKFAEQDKHVANKAEVDGRYPEMSVGFADDLVGRGESVPAEFSFRASGGKSIKDGAARIKRLKGNSVVWNQLAKGAITVEDAEYSISDGVYTLTPTGRFCGLKERNIPIVVGHKYIVLCKKSGGSSSLRINCGGVDGKDMIFTATDAGKNYLNVYCIDEQETVTLTIPKLINLTKAFPNDWQNINTIEDCYARIPMGVDLNAYNEGEVIHMTAEGIKSVGDNAWDEEWELGYLTSTGKSAPGYVQNYIRAKNYIPVISGEKYYAQVPADKSDTQLYACDENYNLVKQIYDWINKTFTIPEGAKYIRFYMNYGGEVYNNDIMITLVHSGWKQDTDAGYQPYWEDRLIFDQRIKDEFPNGMKRWDMVYNKNGKGYVVKGTRVVKMKDLNWRYYTESGLGNTMVRVTLEGIKIPTTNAERVQGVQGVIVLRYYPTQDNPNVSRLQNKCWLHMNDEIFIKDDSFADAESFVASLTDDDVIIYELAEPTIIEYDEPFNLDYRVADFGTEQVIAETNSAPISADIIYQFNAVDMIREHELEIAELQSIIATMQAQLASLTNKE